MITPTRPWSHLPLDILQNAARARRTVELGYGHISATAIRRGETVCPAHVGDGPASMIAFAVSGSSAPDAWG